MLKVTIIEIGAREGAAINKQKERLKKRLPHWNHCAGNDEHSFNNEALDKDRLLRCVRNCEEQSDKAICSSGVTVFSQDYFAPPPENAFANSLHHLAQAFTLLSNKHVCPT